MQLNLDSAGTLTVPGMNLLDMGGFRPNGFASGFSGWESPPQQTSNGTQYFTSANIAVVCVPQFNLLMAQPFFSQFDAGAGTEDPKFMPYLDDDRLDSAAGLTKFAGQMCYLSMGPKRTMNKQAGAYFSNIRKQGHGSVMEHANFSLVFWGINRSLTHELVRHRAGFAYSQVSQRYVDGTRLRFVMRPEYAGVALLEQKFCDWIDAAALEYDERAELLAESMKDQLALLPPTDRRKAVNQAARACLPNETEAPITVTGNVRAWRHFLNMRGALAAEPEIRGLALKVFVSLFHATPELFGDFEIRKDGAGRIYLHTDYPKV